MGKIYTPIYGFEKDDENEFYDINVQNRNIDKFENIMNSHDERLKQKEVPLKIPFATNKSIDSFPVGTLDAPVSNLKVKGLSLVNSAIMANSSFAIAAATNGILQTDGTINSNNLSPYEIDLKAGDKYFVYMKFANTSTTKIDRIYSANDVSSVGTQRNFADTLEVYNMVTINADTFSRIAVRSTDAGTLVNENFAFINMTALGIESYTEEQMLDLVRGGYFEGLDNVKNLVVESVGKNLFDKSKATLNYRINNLTGNISTQPGFLATDFIKVQPGKYYKFSGIPNAVHLHGAFYDAYKNIIDGPYSSIGVTAPAGAVYFRYSVNMLDIDTFMMEENRDQTLGEYEEYKSSKLSANIPLRSLPNGISDRVIEADGQIWLEKNVEEHILTESDIVAVTVNTNPIGFDRYTIQPPNMKLQSGVDSIGDSIFGTYREFIDTSANLTSSDVPCFSTRDDTSIAFFTVTGEYTSLAEAQADLAGTVIQYQLETPQLINLTEQGLVGGELLSRELGTVYNSSDTFHSPNVSFDVPVNTGAVIESLVESADYQSKQLIEKANKKQEDWIELDLLNGWLDTGFGREPSYRLDEFGVLHMKGLATGGTSTNGTIVGYLPIGRRPNSIRYFTCFQSILSPPLNIAIYTDGSIQINNSTGGNISFDQINFEVM